MSGREWVDSSHYRDTSDDGSSSYLYEVDDSGLSHCTEVADHHQDGTTDAYEVDSSGLGSLLSGGKGEHK